MKTVLTIGALVVVAAVALDAQQTPQAAQPAAASAQETARISKAWAHLAAGQLDQAQAAADEALERHPSNPSAVDVVIEVALTRSGSGAALDRYEKWLGAREVEHAFALRQIARGLLREVAAVPGLSQMEAQKALLADRDDRGQAGMADGASKGNPADLQLLAASGDAAAVKAIVASIGGPIPVPAGQIRALGESKSAQAVPGLIKLLDDPRPDVRMEAASALRKLEAREALPALRARMTDMYPPVRVQAAAALYVMDDGAGIVELMTLAQSEYDTVRVDIAEIMATKPDAGWQERVRALSSSTDPLVKVRSASLLATFDPAAAQAVLEGLSTHESLPIREAAGRALAAQVLKDLTALRKILRDQDVANRVAAAARILSLTR